MKPHSKHGILKRALIYIEQLSSVLNDGNNFKTEEKWESVKGSFIYFLKKIFSVYFISSFTFFQMYYL